MEGKQRALDQIAARQRAADEKRRAEAERLQQTAMASSISAGLVISDPIFHPHISSAFGKIPVSYFGFRVTIILW
jgi:hypothetical protein